MGSTEGWFWNVDPYPNLLDGNFDFSCPQGPLQLEFAQLNENFTRDLFDSNGVANTTSELPALDPPGPPIQTKTYRAVLNDSKPADFLSIRETQSKPLRQSFTLTKLICRQNSEIWRSTYE